MPIAKGEVFAKRDVFVGYSYESVMFRWDHQKKEAFQKFYGELPEDETPVSLDNKLFNDALLNGHEISRDQYFGDMRDSRINNFNNDAITTKKD